MSRRAAGTSTSTGGPGGRRSYAVYTPAGLRAAATGRASGGLSDSVRRWNDSAGRPVVSYWKVPDLGHAWSGGVSAGSYTDSRGPSVTEAMRDFFAECAMEHDRQVAERPPVFARARARLVALVLRFSELGRRSPARNSADESAGRFRPHRLESSRWPEFPATATRLAVAGVAAIPMRLGDQIIGSLNLYSTQPREWCDGDLAVASVLGVGLRV